MFSKFYGSFFGNVKEVKKKIKKNLIFKLAYVQGRTCLKLFFKIKKIKC